MALRARPAPPGRYRQLRRAFDAGRHREVATTAPLVRAELAADAHSAPWTSGVDLLAGLTAAHAQELALARSLLSAGLEGLQADHADAVAEDIGDPSPYALALAEVLVALGDLSAASAQAEVLVTPLSPPTVRLGATRALATVAMLRGSTEDAHHHLITATALAEQLRSQLQMTLVDADRAVLRARSGQRSVAVAEALPLVGRLEDLVAGPHGRIAASAAAVCGLEVARLAADQPRPEPGIGQLLEVGVGAARRSGRPTDEALALLARAAVARSEGRVEAAADHAEAARRAYEALGCRLAAASATLEQGLVARSAGWDASAGPLLRRALAEAVALGLASEASRARTALRPPP